MEWLNDRYVIQAGDVALAWAGRGYNWETKRWETISGKNLSRSRNTPYRLRCMQIWVYNATAQAHTGILGSLYVVADPMATGFTIKLPGDGMQSGDRNIVFVGSYPMCAGVLWRLKPGAVVATDIVECTVGYDR